MVLGISFPYISEEGYLDKVLDRFGDNLEEIYLPLPSRYAGSGRSIFYEDIGYEEIIEKCKQHEVKVDILINASCEGLEPYTPTYWERINPLLKRLVDKGVDMVTVSNPLYIQKIKKLGFKVRASVISRINSVQKARWYKKLGVDAINLDRDINRNLELIKQIRDAVNCELWLLVNEGCLLDCPFKHFHDNLIGHLSRIPPNHRARIDAGPFTEFCTIIRRKYPEEILKSPWIRPEDLKYYEDIVDGIKISGRDLRGENMIEIIEAYVRRDYRGNLINLMNVKTPGIYIENKKLDGFLEGNLNCNRNCHSCNYCKEFAKRVITENENGGI